ncbi:MAG: NAD(P)/FAD-dependent oxidoreductase [Bilifractor sp.]
MRYQADVVIVGAGAVGGVIARELSRFKLNVIVVEQQNDVVGYCSKANGATVSSGQDSKVGTKEAKWKVASNRIYRKITKDLDVNFKQVGAMTVAFREEEIGELKKLQADALENGVYDTEIISPQRAYEIVPSLGPDVKAAFWDPGDCIIDVFELVLANMQNAMHNGVHLMLSTKVTGISLENHAVRTVHTTGGDIETRFVINCCGIHADELAKMVGCCDFRNYARAGEFFVLDKNLPYAPKCLVNPLPSPETRGILIVPTIHGNLLLGPTLEIRDDVDDTRTTKPKLDQVIASCRERIPAIDPRDSVTQFTGVRPAKTPSGWCVRATEAVYGYLEAVGIMGAIGAGPAIAVEMREILANQGLELIPKDDFDPVRLSIPRFNEMSEKERAEAIARDPRYGHIICRCETVTEAEIVEAIRREPHATSLDAIKRRLRAGMGRCQGGFCSPRVVEILARELNVPAETICKNEKGSEILTRKNRAEDINA